MWDQHMHCMFSGDSDADPVLMIISNQQRAGRHLLYRPSGL